MLFNQKITPKELLNQAKELKFTNNGEIFSATYLHQLLRLNLHHLDNQNTENFLYNGVLNSDKIMEELEQGSILLIAYDSDVRHFPAKLNGHKAHWALVIGYLVTQDQEIHVIARHGKSKYLAVWPLKDLSDSNANLREFAQPKQHQNLDFVLPEGGIGGENGLCQKCIVIRGLKNKEIVL